MPESDKSAASTSTATPELFALGRQALLDITTADTIGDPAGSITEPDGAVTLYFATTVAAYTGWRWTVSIAQVNGLAPSVLETELTPGDGALLSPDWVPWVDRLADYKEAQAVIAAELAAAGVSDDDDSDDDDDDDDFDENDVNDDDEALLHSGDLDGVDIDVLDDIAVLDDADALDDDDLLDADEDGDASDTSDAADAAAGAVSASASTSANRNKKANQTKGESGDAGPQQPKKSRRAQSGPTTKTAKDNLPAKTGGRAKKQQDENQGDQPKA